MIGAGAFDRRIDLGRMESPGRDPLYGNVLPVEFVAYSEATPAKVQEESGREFFENGRTYAEKRVVFIVRWIPDVKLTDFVQYDGRTFNIKDTRERGRRQFLELHAESVE